jgi:hypothetical protein
MDGAIELPGEANPLTYDALVRNLAIGSSGSNTQELQTITKQLQEWENQSAFFVELQSIFVNQGLPYEVRYLAILQLLQAVSNKLAWSRGGINKQDKSKIRSRLLIAGYHEQEDRLALQNALLTAKIVRFDFPRDWPNVFDDLDATISGSFQWHELVHVLQLRRALEFLKCIVKELSKASLKLVHLRAKAPELLSSVGAIFLACSTRVPSTPSVAYSVDEANAIGLLLPCICVIRRLLVKGYQVPHRDPDVADAWTMILHFFAPRAQNLGTHSSETSNSQRMLEKSLLQISKLHLEMAEELPVAFALLPHSLELVMAYWGIIKQIAQTYGSDAHGNMQFATDGDASDETTPLVEKLALRGLLILRACLKVLSDPRTIKIPTGQDTAEKEKVLQGLQAVFSPDLVNEVLTVLVNQFFVFRASDLRRWEEEPDEWEAAEGADSEGYRYSIRLTAEKLFLDLTIKYTESVVPSVLAMTMRVANSQVSVPQKESTYTSLGLAADKIFVYYQVHKPSYDFNETIPSLISDLQNTEPGYRLIRRRIAILLGRWIHIQVSKENRPLVYQIFFHLLDKNDPLNDLVVRVTAGRQFKEIVADWEFESEPFLQFAPEILSRLMALIAEVELPETKMALLETISELVENLGQHVSKEQCSVRIWDSEILALELRWLHILSSFDFTDEVEMAVLIQCSTDLRRPLPVLSAKLIPSRSRPSPTTSSPSYHPSGTKQVTRLYGSKLL